MFHGFSTIQSQKDQEKDVQQSQHWLKSSNITILKPLSLSHSQTQILIYLAPNGHLTTKSNLPIKEYYRAHQKYIF